MIDELKLDSDHAEAIVEKGIEFEVYTDGMPDSDADKMEAAHEIVAFAIDAWVTDGLRPDSDDEKIATAAGQIVEIFEYAGITATSKGKISYGPLPEFADGEEDGDESDGEDEVAFDIDDVITDYSEMNGKQRLAAVEEVMGEGGDGLYEDQVAQLLEYENGQEKPSPKVVAFLESVINDDDDDDAEGEGDEDGDAEAEGADDSDEEEGGEPFEGYDEATIKVIKDSLTEAAQDEDEPLEVSQIDYVIDYEKANKNRQTFLKWLSELRAEMEGADAPAEEEPKKATKSTVKASTNGTGSVTLTRDQILAALSDGEVTIEFS